MNGREGAAGQRVRAGGQRRTFGGMGREVAGRPGQVTLECVI